MIWYLKVTAMRYPACSLVSLGFPNFIQFHQAIKCEGGCGGEDVLAVKWFHHVACYQLSERDVLREVDGVKPLPKNRFAS